MCPLCRLGSNAITYGVPSIVVRAPISQILVLRYTRSIVGAPVCEGKRLALKMGFLPNFICTVQRLDPIQPNLKIGLCVKGGRCAVMAFSNRCMGGIFQKHCFLEGEGHDCMCNPYVANAGASI